MSFAKKSGLLIAVCVAVVLTGSVQAAYTPLGNSGWALIVNSAMQPASVAYVHEDQGALAIALNKTFDRPLNELGFFSPLTIEFMKISANATSNIIIDSEYVVNATGVEWSGFDMQLMVNMNNPQAGFNPVTVDGGLLENVSYSNLMGYNSQPILLSFHNSQGNGVLSGIPGDDDAFLPGLVVGSIQINFNPNLAVGSRVALMEIPTVMPEPATVMMLGLGGLAILKKRKQNLC